MKSTLNRRSVARAIASKQGMSINAAEDVIDALIEELSRHLCSGGRVSFRGLGAFSVYDRKTDKSYIDIATGEKKTAPPRSYIKFTVSKKLQDRVRRHRHEHP
jgi:nucleoid DNA-binding protein